ncbi:uncharacterized protein (DUF1499 family) [Albidovulum inexpectatum]|uniref:Uncharacterized protein (DUF1499 family) n=1 Tax=Albidovulum inexpectatum TaxID=196587 RepID=A0A2S5JK42_9RHOB|nr:DUF1499 domain-containing protein [Albidovulum inexpectatum]PPB81625.1 uncharacterized protein (DUF1499 family) [Albidovulum inexpectatum]
MKPVLIVVVALVGAGLAWIRLAPSDPTRWHVAPRLPADLAPQPPGPEAVLPQTGGAHALIRLQGVTPEKALAQLDAIARSTPRTVRLAGDPAQGRITWITRSRLFGFPDYTTAEARAADGGAIVTIHARLRFGYSDMGVNAARLRDWLARLADAQA